MLDISMLLTITDRKLSKEFISFFKAQGVSLILAALGNGTAARETLDLFGLDETEKAVMFSFVPRRRIESLMKELKWELQIGGRGRGIVLTLPISSMGGETAIKVFTEHQTTERNESQMQGETPFELIVVITNEGYVDLVIEAARKGHATGGTIIRARGVGTDEVRKFFGCSISNEKEMVFIVCRHACRNQIMKSIMGEAGIHSKAKSIVFSLPVASAEGLWILEHEQNS
jgi:hypothetical protein